MATYLLQELCRDIETLPSDKLAELRQFIDFLRFTLTSKANPTAPASLMRFAGCWQTVDDSVFDGFVEEIDERRRSAFAAQRERETSLD